MTKSELFKKAWKVARKAAATFGGSSKSYFALSLKQAHKESKMEKKVDGIIKAKDGNNEKTFPHKESLKKAGFKWNGVMWGKTYSTESEKKEVIAFIHSLGLNIIIEENGETIFNERNKNESGQYKSYDDWVGLTDNIDSTDGNFQENRI